MTTIRLLLSIASSQNGYLHQLDINTSFLHGDLDEEVYMKCSQGLKVSIKNIVCKLNKSIYGLKQASRQWNQKLTNTVLDLGFSESKFDNSLFTIKYGIRFTCILVYVDDLVLSGNPIYEINTIKIVLDDKFNIKGL